MFKFEHQEQADDFASLDALGEHFQEVSLDPTERGLKVPPEPDRPPTWADLINAEPRLVDLQREAKAVNGDAPHFCANAVWYGPGGLRERVIALVGEDRRPDPLLGTSAAYDVAYHRVYTALPNCRNCGCL